MCLYILYNNYWSILPYMFLYNYCCRQTNKPHIQKAWNMTNLACRCFLVGCSGIESRLQP